MRSVCSEHRITAPTASQHISVLGASGPDAWPLTCIPGPSSYADCDLHCLEA